MSSLAFGAWTTPPADDNGPIDHLTVTIGARKLVDPPSGYEGYAQIALTASVGYPITGTFNGVPSQDALDALKPLCDALVAAGWSDVGLGQEYHEVINRPVTYTP